MRKTPTLTITFVVCLIALTALGAIIRFTDKPNAVPVGSDFFALQRNQDYINASVNQFSNMLFTAPNFTGNGSISGNWTVSGVVYGNAAGMSNFGTGNFIFSTNGIGSNPTFYNGGTFFGAYYFDEVDAKNFYPTNIFFNLTNYAVLGTDGNGQLKSNTVTGFQGPVVMANSPTETNTTIKGDQYGTNAFFITTWGAVISNNINQVVISNGTVYASGPISYSGGTNRSLAVNQFKITDGNGGDTTTLNGSTLTNLTYRYNTNIVGAANFVFGQAYWTNASSNFTFPALTENPNFYETLVVTVTNSGAATITATINGVAGAPGHVVPAVFYCTNATVTEIDVSHFGILWTNACVGKN